MINKRTISTTLSLIVFIGLGFVAYKMIKSSLQNTHEHQHHEEQSEDIALNLNIKHMGFDLLDPELAPDEIKDQVMLGYKIVIDTPKFAKEFVGNNLVCNNCHFCAGNTLGGRNGGISLVGVTNVYPQYSARSKRVINLKERLTNCFMRSMNGKAPPQNSETMDAVVAYLSWISMEVMHIKNPPWLGLKDLKSKHQPDPINGAKVYAAHCAICHQTTGEGTKGVPPLWGNNSYNDGAGMNTLPMLSSFVYYNMPYQEPTLTEEEALDVAAFVIQQHRPVFKNTPKP